MEVIRFTDGPTTHETWRLPDAGWHDWAATVDRFLAHAIRGIAAEYARDSAGWLEINYWQDGGRLIVFPSQDGPHGDRGERVCYELSSEHLETASKKVGEQLPDSEQEAAWEELAERVWRRVGDCLASGAAAAELAEARRSLHLRVAAYDYNPGEGAVATDRGGEVCGRAAMNIEVLAGNILDVPADVLVATANPWLQMTGGVNLAIIVRPRGDEVYDELQRYLPDSTPRIVEPGTVVCTGPGSLPVKKILHAVAIDPSYGSSVELVRDTIVRALSQARDMGARTVNLAALATGFGPLLMEGFAAALRQALVHDWTPLETLRVVVKHDEEAAAIRQGLEPV